MDETILSLETNSKLENLKVADLRKELKSRGLQATGNKSELVARLQESLLNSSIGEPSLEEEKELLVEEDLDKTALAEISEDILSSPEDTLNVVPSITTIGDAPSEQQEDEAGPKPAKIAKISMLENMSPAERKSLRRSKFAAAATSPPTTTTTTVAATGGTNNEKLPLRSNPREVISSNKNMTLADLELLRKRAERFGNNVSSLMKKLEDREKLLKRKMRFNPEGTATPAATPVLALAPKAKSPENNAAAVTNEEKKLLRKQRFNV